MWGFLLVALAFLYKAWVAVSNCLLLLWVFFSLTVYWFWCLVDVLWESLRNIWKSRYTQFFSSWPVADIDLSWRIQNLQEASKFSSSLWHDFSVQECICGLDVVFLLISKRKLVSCCCWGPSNLSTSKGSCTKLNSHGLGEQQQKQNKNVFIIMAVTHYKEK